MRMLVFLIGVMAAAAALAYHLQEPGPAAAFEDEVVEAQAAPEEVVEEAPAAEAEGEEVAPGHIHEARPDIGFAGRILHARYIQPYYNFARPSSIPLDRNFSDFVDPIGRRDRTFVNDPE
ncbi:MAG: hypothetical protein ACYS99_03150, partial [Planctomycetota bacterium]